jgi:hypothetical protein
VIVRTLGELRKFVDGCQLIADKTPVCVGGWEDFYTNFGTAEGVGPLDGQEVVIVIDPFPKEV